MITGETEHGNYVIGTPTKCGTTTLEACAHRHERQNALDADSFRVMDWDSPRRQHRMCLPPAVTDHAAHLGNEDGREDPDYPNEWLDADRYLLVRNPYTRYMSVYTYLSAPANYSQWGARLVQGREWGGHDPDLVIDTDPMTFEEFLRFLAAQRAINSEPKWNARRGPLNDGRAYRSPWVWTDSLTDSHEFLASQQCGGCHADEGPGCISEDGLSPHTVSLIRLESVWEDLAALSERYGLGETGLLLGGLHSNRTTGYGERGAQPSDEQFWGGIACTRKVWRGEKRGQIFRPDKAEVSGGCSCGACLIGVVAEAEELGYNE
jgi:hypothetical protein